MGVLHAPHADLSRREGLQRPDRVIYQTPWLEFAQLTAYCTFQNMLSPKLENTHHDVTFAHRKELLNHIIDHYARDEPERLHAELPHSPTTYAAGFRKVTYAAFANAINGMAWWLHRALGPGKNFETLCYVGPNDLRHNILLFGAVKAGYKVSVPHEIQSICDSRFASAERHRLGSVHFSTFQRLRPD